MDTLLPLAIGLGLFVSIMFTETLGLATGGLVVPGYVALLLGQPGRLVILACSAGITFVTCRAVAHVAIVYGKRRIALTLLIGYAVHIAARWGVSQTPASWGTTLWLHPNEHDAQLGLIVPGLLALWLDRQGVVPTICSLLCAAVTVRLALIVVLGHAGATL